MQKSLTTNFTSDLFPFPFLIFLMSWTLLISVVQIDSSSVDEQQCFQQGIPQTSAVRLVSTKMHTHGKWQENSEAKTLTFLIIRLRLRDRLKTPESAHQWTYFAFRSILFHHSFGLLHQCLDLLIFSNDSFVALEWQKNLSLQTKRNFLLCVKYKPFLTSSSRSIKSMKLSSMITRRNQDIYKSLQ